MPPGSTVSGRYVIEKLLGCGGMGAVYLASDTVLNGEQVAMKVLHAEYANDERYTQRFLREVQLMRRVNHRNVVRTFEVSNDGEIVYFTMEYAAGRSLLELIQKRSLSREDLRLFTIQLCEGLEAIHDAGIIHRDLKPENIIILSDGTVKITDFGVARPEYSELTAHNEVVGSSAYIAPEIWNGEQISSSVDLYSLGVILYELATGVLPFVGDSHAAQMKLHLNQRPMAPRERDRSVPLWLNKLILRLLEKSPVNRPQNAREVIEFLRSVRSEPSSLLPVQQDSAERPAKSVSQSFLSNLEALSQRLTDRSRAAERGTPGEMKNRGRTPTGESDAVPTKVYAESKKKLGTKRVTAARPAGQPQMARVALALGVLVGIVAWCLFGQGDPLFFLSQFPELKKFILGMGS